MTDTNDGIAQATRGTPAFVRTTPLAPQTAAWMAQTIAALTVSPHQAML